LKPAVTLAETDESRGIGPRRLAAHFVRGVAGVNE
jgi:hypothetical protein